VSIQLEGAILLHFEGIGDANPFRWPYHLEVLRGASD